MEDALSTVKSFYDAAGGWNAVQTFHKTNTGGAGAKSGIVMGTEAMQINGYWTPGYLTKLVPSKQYVYGWPPVSADRKGKKMQSTGGHFAVLPRGSPHPDEAFALAAYLTTDTAEQLILDGVGYVGARKSFLPKMNTKQYPGLDWYVQSASSADELWGDPVDPVEGYFSDNWKTMIAKVYPGQVTPRDGLGQLQQLCTTQLAKQLGQS